MRARTARLLVATLALAGTTAVLISCFEPRQPACAFSCASPTRLCPEGYTCDLASGLCRNPQGSGICDLTPPPPTDGGPGDLARPDGLVAGDGGGQVRGDGG